MTQAFFGKYFPHHKTTALKKQISSFTQKESETLYQAWERYKELQALCPHRGYESWRISSPSEEVVENLARIPFPQAFKSTSKSTGQHNEILEHLRQVKSNLPILHVISQVPTYVKVLKDLCTVKRKHHVKKIAFLTEQVSAMIEQRIPPKYKDPGCPTISCVIGSREFAQALLDLGASVNLMPYAIYLLIGLRKMKPTSIVLQLADRSTIRPRGVVEDVLVQVDKVYYPVDFLVLDVKVEVDINSKIPILLGRPFLATANTLINCRNCLMKLTFGNMTLEVNIFHITKQPTEEDECHQTYMIDALTQEKAPTTIDYDPLNSFILNSEILYGFDVNEYANIFAIFAKLQDHRTSPWQPKFEELPERTRGQKPSSIDSPKPELKQFLKGLKMCSLDQIEFQDLNYGHYVFAFGNHLID
ncbi:uncharacterized protein LOC111411505 [Olea europaea var. sylvestris]|uniref:uncharacterized protein LOC111411505 n=1 Tax=Olea europaea var. sylvestris TaxID=158386 RepID=UPI000C1CFB3A|nr:uncharacterized protein LOC111411505 [Olea europaea var. sylvestris]